MNPGPGRARGDRFEHQQLGAVQMADDGDAGMTADELESDNPQSFPLIDVQARFGAWT